MTTKKRIQKPRWALNSHSILVASLGRHWWEGPPPDWLKDHEEAEAATIFKQESPR